MHLVPVDTYLTFGNGKKRPADEGNGTFNVFGSNGVIGHCDEFNNPAGTIIIGRVGSYCGSVHYSPEQCWVTDNAIKGTAKTGADARYCYYLLLTRDLHSLRGGSGQPLINQTSLKSLEVPERSFADQKAIAHILGTLDDKIELNQKMNQTLEEIAKAIFKSWFVDFDPVRAKAEGRPTGLPPEISDLFPDELVDSEIGEIPEGWNQIEVVDLCDYVSSGGTPARKTQEYWTDGDIDWFKTGELRDRPLLHALEQITNLGVEKSAAKLWQRHTILFAIYASPTVGRLGYLTSPGTCNQAAAGLVAKQEIGMPFVFWTLFNARKELQNIAVGAAQQNINVGILKAHKCLEPTHDLIAIFSEFGLVIERRRELIEKENLILSELRDTLLPKLISGELRIPDAEKFLEEAGI